LFVPFYFFGLKSAGQICKGQAVIKPAPKGTNENEGNKNVRLYNIVEGAVDRANFVEND
jgi:hypothetical protein